MSYILDALKKSEYERNLGRNLAPGDGVPGVAAPRPLWPRIVGLLLALNLLGIALMVWWPEGESASSEVAAVSDAASTASAPAPAAVETDSADPRPASVAPTPVAPLAEVAAPTAPALTETAHVAPPPKAPAARIDDAPPLRLLPAEFQSTLPPLQVNIHVYGEDASARLLYINDRQARVGEFVHEGVRVEAIVADGAVLSYRGRLFKLPRPN